MFKSLFVSILLKFQGALECKGLVELRDKVHSASTLLIEIKHALNTMHNYFQEKNS